MFALTLNLDALPTRAMLAVGAGYAATVLREISPKDEFSALFRQLIRKEKCGQSTLSLTVLSEKWCAESQSLRFRGKSSAQKVVRKLCNAALLRLGHAQQLLDRSDPVVYARLDVKSRRQIFAKIFESILLLAQAWALALGKTATQARAFWSSLVAALSARAWQQHKQEQNTATAHPANADLCDQRTPMEWLQIIEPAIFSPEVPSVQRMTRPASNRTIQVVQRFVRDLDVSLDIEGTGQSTLCTLDELLGSLPLTDSLRAGFAGSIFGVERQFLLGVAVLSCILFSTLAVAVHPGFTFAGPMVSFASACLFHWATQARAD
ncbi:MAG: hypothetical protein ACKO2P_03410 [Planctomycetota bacterium]